MTDPTAFGTAVALGGAVVLAAVAANAVGSRLRIPAPLLVLLGGAVVVSVVPSLHQPTEPTVERLVSLALVVILYDGGTHLGWRRLRAAAGATAATGVLGTFLTTAASAAVAHYVMGLEWYAAVLVAAAVAPTDPAVVFSLLRGRELPGRAGTILEGEAGLNDPVSIAIMTTLITAGGIGAGALTDAAREFCIQMGIGAALGLLGGAVILRGVPRLVNPGQGLSPLLALAAACCLFGLATIAQGSGFLAVFVAGVLVGDRLEPHDDQLQPFSTTVASLAEVVAFVLLGATVHLSLLARWDVLLPGLLLGSLLALAVRPIAVGACLLPIRLLRIERLLILAAGLKGAVPILLGELVRTADVTDPERLYGIVVVVVILSVLVQGAFVTTAAARWGVP